MFDLLLDPNDHILKLRLKGENYLPIYVDWVSLWKKYQNEKGFSKNPLYKALGLGKRKSGELLTIWDTTCGLGRDSLRFLRLGLDVWAFERSSTIFQLLSDGIKRAKQLPQLSTLIDEKWHLIEGDVRQIRLSHTLPQPDIIYLDPMYTVDPKRTALSGKEMRILHQVVGEDEDALQLLNDILNYAKKRVVVKRALRAPHLRKPDIIYSGTTTRYDVYLPNMNGGGVDDPKTV